jgi:hypothetical protein
MKSDNEIMVKAKNIAGLFKLAVLVCVGLMFSGVAEAASDGILGAASSGTTLVTLTIPEQFRISKMKDISLGSFSGQDLSGSTDVCVYSNGPGAYQVRITGSTGGFKLENADHSGQIPMNVGWHDAAGAAGAMPVSHGAASPMTSANTQSADCAQGANANLSVAVDRTAMASAAPGVYSNTLTVMIEPN